ncbi:MAG: BLUF domain-containing protein [Pseudomonadota bacterium]
MRGIVYVSEAQMYFDNMSLESLAADAGARNFELGVSGYLYFEKDRFVQYVEGDEDVIDGLMTSIRADVRHRMLHQVVEDNLRTRRFPSWHMRYLSRQELESVKLEHVLTDYLMYMDTMKASAPVDSSNWETIVWGMVNRLSNKRGRLGFQ